MEVEDTFVTTEVHLFRTQNCDVERVAGRRMCRTKQLDVAPRPIV